MQSAQEPTFSINVTPSQALGAAKAVGNAAAAAGVSASQVASVAASGAAAANSAGANPFLNNAHLASQ